MCLLRKVSNVSAYGHRCVYECVCMFCIRSKIITKHFHGLCCFIGWSLCSACITSCRARRWPLRFDAEALRSHGIRLSVIRHTLLCHAVLRYHLRREHDESAAFVDHAVKTDHVRQNGSQNVTARIHREVDRPLALVVPYVWLGPLVEQNVCHIKLTNAVAP